VQIKEGQAGARAPVSQKAVLDVLWLQGFFRRGLS
jgi:hypothetical protein